MTGPRPRLPPLLLLALAPLACKDDGPQHDREALEDPATCEACHPDHYREWLGSMHAYASEDPVFRAMNARGQRETEGALGDFCVNCHAPMAVALGLTEDGLNLDELPQKYQGVTCYFCHQTTDIEGTHNNPLRLALDTVMRAAVVDPLEPEDHGVGRSELLDGDKLASAQACGSCHDIVTPAGAHIERTFAEWQASFYSDPDPDFPDEPALYGLTCVDCHMRRETGPIADYPGVRGDRDRHGHGFVGVDLALTDFPDAELGPQLRAEQREAIDQVHETVLCASLCVRPDPQPDPQNPAGAEITVWLHNEAAGHAWPSGATPDRRAWVELVARDEGDAILLESGVLAEGQAIAELDDPNLWLLRDRIFDAQGDETHMFWEAASYESELLQIPDEFGAGGHAMTWVSRSYASAAMPARVDMRVRLRPMGLEILESLVDSGDLDPAVIEAMPTYDLPPTTLAWTPAEAEPSTGEVDYGSCVSSSPGCKSPFI